jgi:7,8-dihydro-6-hydroxymethylpterin dimethyltransferase
MDIVREASSGVPGKRADFAATKGLCGVCKRLLPATVFFQDGKVYLEKACAEHGREVVLVASSEAWYRDALSFTAEHAPPRGEKKAVEKGCPFDCGPCTEHKQRVVMPVVPITSACNLDCPICYTVNKNEGAHVLSKADFQRMLDHLRAQHDEIDIINFTGGEPTMHPELPELCAMARAAGIERITISTNGLKLLDEAYVKRLAEVDATIVLSLDTFRREVDEALLGANTIKAKLRVLDLLEQHDVTATILPAVAAGYNDDEVGALLDVVLTRPNITSLELHTLTFTGQGGVGFDRKGRITTPDLHRRIEEHTNGRITWRDFVPSPLAHPHCYSICYVLMLDGGGLIPFTRIMPREDLFDLLRDSLYIEPRARIEEVLRDAIDRLWSDPDALPGGERESEVVLSTLKRLVQEMFPSDQTLSVRARRRAGERSIKAIYIHSHMDEENFDTERIQKCSIGVPLEDGGNLPTCAYNVIYREKDARFADQAMLARMTEGKKRLLPVLQV